MAVLRDRMPSSPSATSPTNPFRWNRASPDWKVSPPPHGGYGLPRLPDAGDGLAALSSRSLFAYVACNRTGFLPLFDEMAANVADADNFFLVTPHSSAPTDILSNALALDDRKQGTDRSSCTPSSTIPQCCEIGSSLFGARALGRNCRVKVRDFVL